MSRILLAIDQPEVGRAELRAMLLARQVGVSALDVIATRRAGAGIGTRTAFSQLRVDDGALSAMIGGQRHGLDGAAAIFALPQAWTVRDASAASLSVRLPGANRRRGRARSLPMTTRSAPQRRAW